MGRDVAGWRHVRGGVPVHVEGRGTTRVGHLHRGVGCPALPEDYRVRLQVLRWCWEAKPVDMAPLLLSGQVLQVLGTNLLHLLHLLPLQDLLLHVLLHPLHLLHLLHLPEVARCWHRWLAGCRCYRWWKWGVLQLALGSLELLLEVLLLLEHLCFHLLTENHRLLLQGVVEALRCLQLPSHCCHRVLWSRLPRVVAWGNKVILSHEF